MTRSEIERVKACITRSTDRFRPSYGRRVIEVPRQAVFFGSTNALEYLKDETDVWFEITTLLIPGENDSPVEIEAESA